MMRQAWTMLLVAASCAACAPAAEPVGDGVLERLSAAYAPYQACVVKALQSRKDFDGRLPEMIVASGTDVSLQNASRRYLGQAVDLESLDAQGRVDATRMTLQSLGAFGAELARGVGTSYPDKVRRQMAMVEVMQVMAAATSVDCSPSDSLLSSMELANNEYL